MFAKSSRYLTKGIQEILKVEVQVFLWGLVDSLNDPKDYLQVFELKKLPEGWVKVVHKQEEPEYYSEALIKVPLDVDNIKIFVIDSGDYSTMLLADEY